MKFLFSSSDSPQVVFLKKVLDRAGIPCAVLQVATTALPNKKSAPAFDVPLYPELWVQKEEDFLTASMLLASQHAAFHRESR